MNPASKVNFSTSAPGKIILFGEHSVVYGKRAVAASISCRTTTILSETDNNVITVSFSNLQYSQSFELDDLKSKLDEDLPLKKGTDKMEVNLARTELIDIDSLISISSSDVPVGLSSENAKRIKTALHVFFFLLRGVLSSTSIQLIPCSIEVQSQLVLGAGTGSSASFCVAIVAAILQLLKQKSISGSNVSKIGYQELIFDGDLYHFSEKEKDIISGWAYCGEKISHGNPSGIDNSICTHGSVLEMNKGSKGAFHFLKDAPKLGLLLINSGVDRNTSSLVSKVRTLKESHGMIVNCILDGMEKIAEKAVTTLSKLSTLEQMEVSEQEILKQYVILEELFDLNHGLLATLAVSHKKLEHIREITAVHGLHTKLTGAGGGGYAITLIPPNFPLDRLTECINQLGASGYQTDKVSLGGEGVSVKKLE